MKRCPKCGKYYEDSRLSCPDCRVGLIYDEGDNKSVFDHVADGIGAFADGMDNISDEVNRVFNRRPSPSRRFTKKELNKIRKVRSGKSNLPGRVCLFGFGGLFLLATVGAYDLLEGIVYLIIGLALAGSGVLLTLKTRNKVRMWDRYDALIRWTGNTSLEFLAGKTGKTVEQVSMDIQNMINRNFLIGPEGNLSAFIDGEYELLIMTDYRTGKPLEPVDEYLKGREVRETRENKAGSADTGRSGTVKVLRRAFDEIEDDEVREYVFQLAGSVGRIEKKLSANPELRSMPVIQKLESDYTPQMVKLVETYRTKDGSPDVLARVGHSLKVCAEAFENIEDKLYEKDDFETMVDLDVMEATFRKDGLLDSEFDI